MFTCIHVLEDQVIKDIILSWVWCGNLKTQTEFKTWKAKSWIGRSLSRLGNGVEKMKHFKTWDAKSWTKNIISEMWWLPKLENKFYCVHVLEDQWTKSWKDKTIIQLSTIFERPGRWSQLRQAWVVRLGFKPWTFEEFTCIMLVIMFVSARLERPSLEVYLRFTIVPNPNRICRRVKWPSLNLIFNFHI